MKKIIFLIQNQSLKNTISATSKMTVMLADITIVFYSQIQSSPTQNVCEAIPTQ